MNTDNREDTTSGRLMSLDALRGFDMFWIIGGAAIFRAPAEVWENPITRIIQQQLHHVKWDGFHFYDLIYPLFLFIIGVVLPFSLARRMQQGQSRYRLYLHIFKRSVMLILLGSVAGGLLRFTHWPSMGGVLEHIGLCYFFAVLIVMHTKWRTQAAIVVGFLILYWIACAVIAVPGSAAGAFTEEGNLASSIDRWFISGRLWNEGPTSTLSGICIILWGTLAGHWLRTSQPGNRKAAALALAGGVSVIVGYVWGFSFPIIKRILWTSSYVTYACGWSLVLLAIFYWVIDVKGYKKWAFFFIVIGTNAITIYFLQRIVNFDEIANLLVKGIGEHAGTLQPLILPVGVLTVKWLFLWFLYRHKIFFKV
ncbi:MAG: acyltransferase family protein [Planctomycetota bacterium]|jgi:predicted acyltransferase